MQSVAKPPVAAAVMMLNELVAAWAEVAESFACTKKYEVAVALGVPLMTPELESVNPAGRLPEASVHV